MGVGGDYDYVLLLSVFCFVLFLFGRPFSWKEAFWGDFRKDLLRINDFLLFCYLLYVICHFYLLIYLLVSFFFFFLFFTFFMFSFYFFCVHLCTPFMFDF